MSSFIKLKQCKSISLFRIPLIDSFIISNIEEEEEDEEEEDEEGNEEESKQAF
jgi:hypothetical protein